SVAPQAGVDMATAARLIHERFGHEGHALAALRRNLLHALLEDAVHVGHTQRFVVDKIDFVLSPAPFALARLDGNFRSHHVIAHLPKERLILRRLHDVIVDTVIARRWKSAVAARKRFMVSRVEEKKLQLARDVAGEAALLEAFE